MGKLLRKIWHDLYYALAGETAVSFAMHCKQVTEQTNLGVRPSTLKAQLRYWLHLSVCQACKNYYKFSQLVGQKANALFAASPEELQRLNSLLVEQFKKKEG